MNVSLRTQLSLWTGLVVLSTAFIIAFLAQGVIVWMLERSTDESLWKHTNFVSAIIASDITTDEESYALVIKDLASQDLPFVPSLLRVISPSGKPIVEFGKIPVTILSQLNGEFTGRQDKNGHFSTVLINGHEFLRVYTAPVTSPTTGNILAFVQSAESLSEIDEIKGQIWQSGIIIALIASLLAITASQLISWRQFKSLRMILKRIDEIDYDHLKSSMYEETRPTEVQQLANSLTAMQQRLDASVSAQQRNLGAVSHELRTPLTALKGHIELLLLQQHSLKSETRDSLQRMLHETDRLIRLVRNLLLNFQLETTQAIKPEKVNLRKILDDVIGDIWVLSEGLDFDIDVTEDIMVLGDPDLLKQMILNVIDNAIKYTGAGGKIGLGLKYEQNQAVITVSDNGRGMMADLPTASEPLLASEGSLKSNNKGGIGLGLSIVRQIIKLHNGTVEIVSKQGKGTIVQMKLPLI